MRRFRRFWAREGDMMVWTVEALSGLTLLLYAVVSIYTRGSGIVSSVHMGLDTLVSPYIWQPTIGIIGLVQIACSVHRNPLCSIITAYPAMVACLYAAVSGCIYGIQIEPLTFFALAWGALNYAVIRHNWAKARNEVGG